MTNFTLLNIWVKVFRNSTVIGFDFVSNSWYQRIVCARHEFRGKFFGRRRNLSKYIYIRNVHREMHHSARRRYIGLSLTFWQCRPMDDTRVYTDNSCKCTIPCGHKQSRHKQNRGLSLDAFPVHRVHKSPLNRVATIIGVAETSPASFARLNRNDKTIVSANGN